jgi:hypothetical protein
MSQFSSLAPLSPSGASAPDTPQSLMSNEHDFPEQQEEEQQEEEQQEQEEQEEQQEQQVEQQYPGNPQHNVRKKKPVDEIRARRHAQEEEDALYKLPLGVQIHMWSEGKSCNRRPRQYYFLAYKRNGNQVSYGGSFYMQGEGKYGLDTMNEALQIDTALHRLQYRPRVIEFTRLNENLNDEAMCFFLEGVMPTIRIPLGLYDHTWQEDGACAYPHDHDACVHVKPIHHHGVDAWYDGSAGEWTFASCINAERAAAKHKHREHQMAH